MTKVPGKHVRTNRAVDRTINVVARRFSGTVGYREAKQIAWVAVLEVKAKAPALVYTVGFRAVLKFWRRDKARPDPVVGDFDCAGGGGSVEDVAAALACARRCADLDARCEAAAGDVEMPDVVRTVGRLVGREVLARDELVHAARELGLPRAVLRRHLVRYRRTMARHPVANKLIADLRRQRASLLEECAQ